LAKVTFWGYLLGHYSDGMPEAAEHCRAAVGDPLHEVLGGEGSKLVPKGPLAVIRKASSKSRNRQLPDCRMLSVVADCEIIFRIASRTPVTLWSSFFNPDRV